MKKVIVSTAASSLLLMYFVGCSNSSYRDTESLRPLQKATPKITVTDERSQTYESPSSEDALTRTEKKAEYDDSCRVDTDCVVIPTDGCIPCADNAGQIAVNKTEARRVMGPKKDQCMPVLEKLRENQGKGVSKSTHETCSYNGANCVEGTCQLAELSEDELKSRMPKMGQGQGHPAGESQGYGPRDGQGMPNFNSPSRQPSFDRGYEGHNRDLSWPSEQGYKRPEYPSANDRSRSQWGSSPFSSQNPFGGAQFNQSNPFRSDARFGQPGANAWGSGAQFGQQGFPGFGSQGANPWSRGSQFGQQGGFPGFGSNQGYSNSFGPGSNWR